MVRVIAGGAFIVLLVLVATWQIQKDTRKAYPTEDFGVTFTYPKDYLFEERELSDGRVLTLIENTPDNETTTTPREGPVSMTIARHRNPEKLGLHEWIRSRQESNFHLSNGMLVPTTIGGENALMYTWSGLYQGESVVSEKDDSIFMFSVTYLLPQDAIRADFQKMLDSVEFEL